MTQRKIAKFITMIIMTVILWFSSTQIIRGIGGLRYIDECIYHDTVVYGNAYEAEYPINQYLGMATIGFAGLITFGIGCIVIPMWFKCHTFKDEDC